MSNLKNFMEDNDKVNDLLFLSRIEFLIKHKDIAEEEYNNTINRILVLINASVKQSKQQRETRQANLEEFRKRDREYKREHKDKYNARRREKYWLKKRIKNESKPNIKGI